MAKKSPASEASEPLEARILKLFKGPDPIPLDSAAISEQLRLTGRARSELRSTLSALERTGRLARIRHDQYTLPAAAELFPGRILISRSGNGTLQPDDPKLKRLEVPAEMTGTAFHNDRVLVRLEHRPEARGVERGAVGKVIRILERARSQVVGILQRTRQFLYVIPDDPRIPHDIYVTLPDDMARAPKVGEKVVVDLLEWASRHNNPEGKVVEVLGKPDKQGVDIESILRQYDLPGVFPPAAVRESERFGRNVAPADHAGRRDCRAGAVITIDPDDAKDFDDAFCVERLTTGGWKLWVHIADVSHYVRPGSALDAEAARRGNSTYLVDRVIPMLPEALSNELCSLKPKADRLTKCVEFELASDGRVVKSDFYPAIIHSQKRYTYREALAALEAKPGGAIERMLHDAHRLAQCLRRRRFENGALQLDFPETKLRLDRQGRLERVERMENDISHQLIEEFMLLANEAVARRLRQSQRPAVYRIHEQPDPERLEELRQELAVFGVSCGNLSKKGELAKLLIRLQDHPLGSALKVSVLRSLKRARYAVSPLGHFGLAKSDYTHFTSPIRRYADLLVHRVLFEKMRGGRESLAQVTDHISFTERNSDDAERDSKTVKLLDFLERQLRSDDKPVYSAIVSDIRNFGFFVEIADLGFSGMVRVSTLGDDFYFYDAERGRLIGRRTKRAISLGDSVQVTVASVDRYKKQADFSLVAKADARKSEPGPRRPSRGRSSRPQAKRRERRRR